MHLNKKWLAIAGAVVVAGVLSAGVAMAAGNAPSTNLPTRLQQAVQSGKITQGQADVMLQLQSLRKAAFQKLQGDSKALVDQAVKSGKITQDQANQVLQHRGGHGWNQDGRHHGKFGHMTQDQLKAKLDAAVKAGKITQAQADRIMQRWTQRQQNSQQKGQ